MNVDSSTLPSNWSELPDGDDTGDAIVAALAQGGVEYLFFTSGSELCFYQEAIAKAGCRPMTDRSTALRRGPSPPWQERNGAINPRRYGGRGGR